jgi:hypothetical protein
LSVKEAVPVREAVPVKEAVSPKGVAFRKGVVSEGKVFVGKRAFSAKAVAPEAEVPSGTAADSPGSGSTLRPPSGHA